MPAFPRYLSRGPAKLPALIFLLAAACPGASDTTGGGGEAGSGGAPTGGSGGMINGGGGSGGTPDGGGGSGGNPDGGGGSGGLGGTGGTGGTGGSGGEGGTGGGVVDPNYPPEEEPNGSPPTSNALADGTLGFTAELSSINDIDMFSFFAPLGSTVSVSITDGNGGCPPDANVKLDIYDPQLLEIATQTGLCPVLDGTTEPDLATVALEGTYLARVSAPMGGGPVGNYVIEISVAPPVCGDGVTQLGEECDDMNMTPADGCENNCTETPVCGDGDVQTGEECDDNDQMSGDGCDSMCQLEGDFCPEGEPNNTTATATLLTSCSGGAGQITAAGDEDYFEVVVTVPGSSIRADIVDVLGLTNTCPLGFDSLLELYNPMGVLLGSDDDDGFSACALIHPYPEGGFLADTFAQNLQPGSYFINVTDLFGGTSPPYVVNIDVLPPGCGDGIPQMGEQCDDANTANGDGCSSTCVIEGNYCAESEPNDSTATADVFMSCEGFAAQGTPSGDDDYFAVTVTVAGSSIRAETTNTNGSGCPAGADTEVFLKNSGGTTITSNDNKAGNLCSLIDPVANTLAANLAVGTYYVHVRDFGDNGTIPPYIVKIELNPPGCGDSITQGALGEECDDGNTANGDGCDGTCQLEGNFCTESEPNDSFGQATILNGCQGGSGQINFVADSDWFRFTVGAAGSSARVEIVDTNGTGCPVGFDSFVRLYNSSMTQLGTDNDDGFNACSLINPGTDVFAASLPAGNYFIRVNENGDDATSQPYLVTVNVQAPGCGDSIVQGGEQCDDGNMIDNDGCTNACTLLTCAPGELSLGFSAMGLPSAPFQDATITSTINVSDVGTVTAVVVGFNVDHAWDSDLTMSIDPPGTAPIELFSGIGGSGDDFINTLISSNASNPISGSVPPFTGIFAPETGSLATVEGTASNGAWVLTATDVFSDAGILQTYTLAMCVDPP